MRIIENIVQKYHRSIEYEVIDDYVVVKVGMVVEKVNPTF